MRATLLVSLAAVAVPLAAQTPPSHPRPRPPGRETHRRGHGSRARERLFHERPRQQQRRAAVRRLAGARERGRRHHPPDTARPARDRSRCVARQLLRRGGCRLLRRPAAVLRRPHLPAPPAAPGRGHRLMGARPAPVRPGVAARRGAEPALPRLRGFPRFRRRRQPVAVAAAVPGHPGAGIHPAPRRAGGRAGSDVRYGAGALQHPARLGRAEPSPVLAGEVRLAWGPTDDPSEIAVGGHLGWLASADTLFQSRAVTADARFKVGPVELLAEAFSGKALAGLGGAGSARASGRPA